MPEQHEKPYLHVRPTYRTGEELRAELRGNRAGLLRLREQIDEALGSDRRADGRYLGADGGVRALSIQDTPAFGQERAEGAERALPERDP